LLSFVPRALRVIRILSAPDQVIIEASPALRLQNVLPAACWPGVFTAYSDTRLLTFPGKDDRSRFECLLLVSAVPVGTVRANLRRALAFRANLDVFTNRAAVEADSPRNATNA
jgi:hypothetical protein